jgi:O-antigen ligase
MTKLSVVLAAFFLPQYFSLWAKESKALVGFSIANWTLAAAVGLSLVLFVCTYAIKVNEKVRFPLDREMWVLFIAPYVISHLVGYPRAEEIPVELAYQDGGFASLRTWYLSHLAMSLLTTIGIAVAIALALRRGLKQSHLLVVTALPLWPVVLHAVMVTFTSGLSLGELTSETNRSFLQNDTNFGLHGNAFGQYAVFAYILFAGAAAGSKDAKRPFFLATAAVATLGVLVSFSRTAWGAWILVTALWNAKGQSHRRWLVPAVMVFALLMMPEELVQRIWKGVAERDIDQILSGRLERMWLPVLHEVWSHPLFGQGWGAYMWSEAFKTGLVFQTATVHNAYVRLLLESGMVGLLLVVSFYFSVWRQTKKLEVNEADALTKAMLNSSRWLVFAMLITGVTGDAITPEMIQVYFWYGIGIFLAAKLQARERPEVSRTWRLAA